MKERTLVKENQKNGAEEEEITLVEETAERNNGLL